MRVDRVVSLQNPRIKQLRRLREDRYRRQTGLLLLEGGKLVLEAARAGCAIDDVLVDEGALERPPVREVLDRLAAMGVERVTAVPERILAAVSTMRTPHDLVATARRPAGGSAPPVTGGPRSIIALDGLQDPGNVGSILRSALAFGFDRAWCGAGTADPYHPKVLRASAGAVFWFVEVRTVHLATALAEARASGYTVAALDAHRGEPIRAGQLRPPLIVTVGAEGAGVRPDTQRQVDLWFRIPTDDRVESLNAAAAAAIALYELRRLDLARSRDMV